MARDRKAALAASMQAEREAVEARVPGFDRFEKAEAALGGGKSPTPARAKKLAATSVAAHPQEVRVGGGPTEKVIRDSFTMPSRDYKKITQLRAKCLKAGLSVTKSEILRAGLHALEGLSLEKLREVMQSVEKVKPGRPAQG